MLTPVCAHLHRIVKNLLRVPRSRLTSAKRWVYDQSIDVRIAETRTFPQVASVLAEGNSGCRSASGVLERSSCYERRTDDIGGLTPHLIVSQPCDTEVLQNARHRLTDSLRRAHFLDRSSIPCTGYVPDGQAHPSTSYLRSRSVGAYHTPLQHFSAVTPATSGPRGSVQAPAL
jgi:hypothetical protein